VGDRCIKEEKDPLTGGEDVRLAIRIALAAREVADTGKAIPI